jgi:hypothetical protein
MSKRILVVENQEDNRQIICDLLADTDYEISEAENGEEDQPARLCCDAQNSSVLKPSYRVAVGSCRRGTKKPVVRCGDGTSWSTRQGGKDGT